MRHLVTLLLFAACTIPSFGQAKPQEQTAPKAITELLMQNPEAKECLTDKYEGGFQKNFEATRLKLTAAADAAWLVTGKNPYCSCGATGNCLTYLFDLSKGHYRLLLESDGLDLSPLNSTHSGYVDLESSLHVSGWYGTVAIFEFDGTQYRQTHCYSRQFNYIHKNAKGEEETIVLNPPETMEIKCGVFPDIPLYR